MKKILSLILTASILISPASITAYADAYSAEKTYTSIKIPFPENIDEKDSWRTYAKYTDSGKIITLSGSYDGYVWATVPTEYRDKKIEAVIPQDKIFTDIANDYEFYSVRWLSRANVICGNENGEAQPLRNITRAEATSMIIRFMGLEDLAHSSSDTNLTTFEDVQKGRDWFFDDVTYANKIGIVVGDSASTFSPQRNITLEEFSSMTARALQYANLKCTPSSPEIAEDADDISDWAKESFEILGICRVYDYAEDESDWENPKYYLKPQLEATRLYAADLLNGIQSNCQMYPSSAAAYFGFDKEMPIIDGSTSTYPFTQAVYDSLFFNGRSHSQFPAKHSKSHSSYQRLINGEVDMLFASVYPAGDILALAAEKGVELELIPIAYDAMIFFTNADNPINGLTQEQISNIYVNNAYSNWSSLGGSDAKLYAYCRNNDSGSHAQMEKHFLKGSQIHPEIQKETSYTMSNVLTDVMGAQTDNPVGYGLGYSIYYYFNNMDVFYDTKTELKLLSIDGVAPNDETIANGTYPLANNTYIVLRSDTPEDSPARKMADFMLTQYGQMCVEAAGFGRLIPPDGE